MLAVALSAIFPGLGQLYFGKWVRGALMLLVAITPAYPLALVWSVVDAYRLSQSGIQPVYSRKEAVAVVALFLVIVPLCVVLLVVTTSSALAWLQDAHLNRAATVDEGAKIASALLRYRDELGRYPDTLTTIVQRRPLRSGWLHDGWGKPYRYRLEDEGASFHLASPGRDGQFGTEDDLEWRP